MMIDYMAELDNYILTIEPDLSKDFDKLDCESKALFIECSAKAYFAKVLRDTIRERDYSDGITVEQYLRRFQKDCLERASKCPVESSLANRVMLDQRTMWSLAFEVAEAFSDYLEYVYKREVLSLA